VLGVLELAFLLCILFNHGLLLIGRETTVSQVAPRVQVFGRQIVTITESGGLGLVQTKGSMAESYPSCSRASLVFTSYF
jgi:hypothetical protein